MRSKYGWIGLIVTLAVLSGCGGAAQTATSPAEEVTPQTTHELRPTDTPTPAATDQPDQPADDAGSATAEGPLKPPGHVETGLAVIDSMEVAILESFPVQVSVTLKGNLPDGCTSLGTIDQTYDAQSKTFTLTVPTNRPTGVFCTEALVPFQENVMLPVAGLAKGTYTVRANDQTTTFELQADNGPAPTP